MRNIEGMQENEILDVEYMSRDDFEKINQNPPANSICISISTRYDRFRPVELSPKWDNTLRLTFDAHVPTNDEHGFTDELADSVVKFALDNIKPTTEKLIVHCGEGRVRSPAIAIVIGYMYYAPANDCKSMDKEVFWQMKRAFKRKMRNV